MLFLFFFKIICIFFIKNEKISNIKVGKNLHNLIIETYSLSLIDELLSEDKIKDYNYKKEFLNFLDDFINPNQYVKR